jgi:predicted TIM-barrel fold metal-dependent hydrolase
MAGIGAELQVAELPKIISVDDHVIEPPDLWQRWLPKEFVERGPRVERQKGEMRFLRRRHAFKQLDHGDWADIWMFDGMGMPLAQGLASAGTDRLQADNRPMRFEEMRPGAYQREARLADMDLNHTKASLNFPTFARFCGQTFLECEDRPLALACVEAYNNWMIQEWCGDSARGRLLPMALIPLWDVELAAAEVHRCAELGNCSIAFSESPPALDLPSIHSGYWDPLWQSCVETATVVNCHIGSSSTFPTTGPDSPLLTSFALVHEGSQRALVDWLCSGIFERFDTLRVVLSEGQVGWIPYLLDRIDRTWKAHEGYAGVSDRITRPPSSYVEGHIYGCVVDDIVGLEARHRLPFHQLMFEVDFPHGDSHWPNSASTAARLVADAGLTAEETTMLLHDNAIACYGLERFGLEPLLTAAVR